MQSLVLLSGGLDSAVLLAQEAQRAHVLPVYVSGGLAWEQAEKRMLRVLLDAPVFGDRLESLIELDLTVRDVYKPTHWAIRGTPPAYDTPDEDVYLAGRNIVLLAKAAIVAASRGIDRIALGTLANNPFPDATSEFFTAIERALSLGLNHRVDVVTPFASLRKEDVIRLGNALRVPMELTLSCMNPIDDVVPVHCGQCSKCRERRDAFAASSIEDRTTYANPVPR